MEIISVILGVVLGYFLNVATSYFSRKRKLKSYWLALREEAELCKEKSEEFIGKNIAAPLYRLPVLSYETSFPVILANDKLSQKEINSIILYFNRAEHFNRGLDIAEKLFLDGNTKEVNKVHARNKLYAQKLFPRESQDLYSILKNTFDNKLKT